MLGMSCHQSISGRFAGDEALCGYSNRNPKSAASKNIVKQKMLNSWPFLFISLTLGTRNEKVFSLTFLLLLALALWIIDELLIRFVRLLRGFARSSHCSSTTETQFPAPMQIGCYNLPRESRLNFGDVVESPEKEKLHVLMKDPDNP